MCGDIFQEFCSAYSEPLKTFKTLELKGDMPEKSLRPSHRSLMTCSVLFRNGKQKYLICKSAGLGGSVGCVVRLETRRSWVNHRRGRQHSFVEIDHEIFSTVILSLLLIQEGQLSVSGEGMCTILVNRLED